MRTTLHLAALAGVSALALAVQPALAAEEPAAEGAGTIVVTATKRAVALDQAPIAASAVSGKDLAAANAQSLGDYIARLPGVVFNDYQPGVSEVVIRGICRHHLSRTGPDHGRLLPQRSAGGGAGLPDRHSRCRHVRSQPGGSAARPAGHAVRLLHAGRPGQLCGEPG
jgi:outer membrane receptor protein involved in Fe transport